MEQNWYTDIFRGFFATIDSVIYGFIEILYNTFMQISNVMFLSQDAIQEFSYRIYVVLGFIMLFKVSFSLIKIFINPDNMFGDKGVTKIIQRLIIMLIILVSVPTIFSTAYRIQGVIVKENILGNLIIGNSSLDEETLNESVNNMGSIMGDTIMSGFFKYNDGESNILIDVNGTGTYAFNGDNATRSTNNVYDYNYDMIFSTIAGALTVYLLLSFLFDVAVRAAKLTLLQIIAPIPIMMSIDEKGKKNFETWMQSCLKTYLEIFVRLAIIWFVVYLIIELSAGGVIGFYDVLTGEKAETDFFTGAMLILGLLLFAKEAPKLIMDLLGIKDSKFVLSPMKKLKSVPGVEKAMSTAGGAVSGFTAGGRVGNRLLGGFLGAASGFNSSKFLGDGKGGFVNGMNSSYKKLTGNDFLNFQWKPGGAAAVDQIGSRLGKLYSYNNELDQKLADIADETASAREKLINLDLKMSVVTEYNNLDEQLNAAVKSGNQESQNKIKAAMSELGDFTVEQKEAIKEFKNSRDNELAVRGEKSTIEKYIKDLSSEKSQRERFYGYDPSPRDKIEDILDKVDALNKKIDEKK